MMVGVLLVTAVFVALLVRLYALQILRGEELSSRGRRNYVQRVEVLHDRGIIYDRYGRTLADNRPILVAQVIPHFLGKEYEATLQRLAEHLSLSEEALNDVRSTIMAKRGLDRFVPLVVKRNLTREEVEAVEADKSVFRLDGVDIVQGRRRTYPEGTLAAHLLGYVNEVDAEQLNEEKARGNPQQYQRGDLIGREGVENRYESFLRGVDGYENIVVDAKGRRMHGDQVESLLGINKRVEPQPGKNVFLTVDMELQRIAEESFLGRAGALVALDPNNGAVLALVSKPAFDPNIVSGVLGPEEKRKLDEDPLKPWMNRAIRGQYAPGSTFKVATALAALYTGQTTANEKVFCPGYFRMGRHTWRCWRDAGHGAVDLRSAIKVSCDTYFYTMASRVGINAIADAARALGFGAKTGISMRGEKEGLVPDEAFHNRVDAASGGYQRGMAVNTSIGQGSMLVTPLQLAVAYASIANGGRRVTPQIIQRIETADFRVVHRFSPDSLATVGRDSGDLDLGNADMTEDRHLAEHVEGSAPRILQQFELGKSETMPFTPDQLKLVHSGLVAVTSEPGGTAYYRVAHAR
ncbi:MAG: penicillin-binding protein 2 [Myxococcota bacterium]